MMMRRQSLKTVLNMKRMHNRCSYQQPVVRSQNLWRIMDRERWQETVLPASINNYHISMQKPLQQSLLSKKC